MVGCRVDRKKRIVVPSTPSLGGSHPWLRFGGQGLRFRVRDYRGTLLITNRDPLGPCDRTMFVALGGGHFLMREVPLYRPGWDSAQETTGYVLPGFGRNVTDFQSQSRKRIQFRFNISLCTSPIRKRSPT